MDSAAPPARVVVVAGDGVGPEVTAAAVRLLQVVCQAHDISITPTLGISVYPQDGIDAETLLRNADTAMYHAKEGGKNRFEYFRAQP